ncbi:NAD(P)H-binding protein [Vibrio splendidus]|uniref:NAD(P)H-binding protein n=1 Tax=Vibrio splendidus TaxID=29497 RepID=UPI000C83EDCA|nr:NAD(P)H-binding protein [Vibrio splendidus]PMI54336.1 nucleoside-diphosphate sugar epimerase [Vibrio splendidus]
MNKSIIIAGASGLVGKETLAALLKSDEVNRVYALSRHRLAVEGSKLTQVIDEALSVSPDITMDQPPEIGIIALGSTIKKAGTKEKLREIDVNLVTATAEKMQQLGVGHLIVVSCLGADINARSHYLRCKGEMEAKVESLGFEQTTFLHPGPLAGDRDEKRTDEKFLQGLLKIVKPLMIGNLSKYVPIESSVIAQSILTISMMPHSNQVERLNSVAMNQLVS